MLNRIGKSIVLLLAVLVVSAGTAQGQEKKEKVELEVGKWYPKLDFGLVLTQSAYSNNWNGSDQGQIAWNFILNSGLQKRFTPKVNWSNTLKLAFGQTHNQKFSADDPSVRVWDRPEKTADLIDFESLLRFTLQSWVDPYLAARLLSQFYDNSDPYSRGVWLIPQLLCHPGIRRMACHIDMHHPPRLQLDDHEDEDTAEEGIICLQEITRPNL